MQKKSVAKTQQQAVIDVAMGSSPHEPPTQQARKARGATAVKSRAAAWPAMDDGEEATAAWGATEGKIFGRPSEDTRQGYTATAVKVHRKDGKPTRAERGEENSRVWEETLKAEMEEDRKRQTGELEWKADPQAFGTHGEVVPVRVSGSGKPIGRPLEYTPEQGAELCQWIREGKGMTSWCKKTGRAPDAVYRWLRSVPAFREAYEQAQEDRADTLADQLLAVVDDLPPDATMEQVQIAKLRLDARKWIASKLRPGKWGDKQVVEHTGGGISINIGIPQKPATAVIEEHRDRLE